VRYISIAPLLGLTYCHIPVKTQQKCGNFTLKPVRTGEYLHITWVPELNSVRIIA